MINDGIRVEPAETCLLCGAPGRVVYSDLRDRLFAAPGTWSSRRCDRCGLMWLDPRPVAEDIHALYTTYYTHSDAPPALSGVRKTVKHSVLAGAYGYDAVRDGWGSRILGALLSRVPPVRERVGMGVDFLRGEERGRLLDVGCGSGMFLARMKQLGWDVHGIDPDPDAAAHARKVHGIPVTVGELQPSTFPPASFDVVTLNHVIEHAIDPVGLLRTCGALLKPHGRLVVITPNVESLGHAEQGRSWLPLEPPRHLYLFSVATLSRCVALADLVVHRAGTSARSAAAMWTGGRQIALTGRGSLDADTSLRFHPQGLWFQAREEVLCLLGRPAGEELIISVKRPQ